MNKKLNIILLIIINLFINKNVFAEDTIKYKTMAGFEIDLNKNLTEQYFKDNIKVFKSLKNCSKNKINYKNPTHGATGFYEILGKNKEGYCLLKYDFNSITEYQCALKSNDIDTIIKYKEESLKNLKNLEMYTNEESNIFNDKTKCIKKDLSKSSKDLSDKEIDDIKNNNPNLGLLLNSFNKK